MIARGAQLVGGVGTSYYGLPDIGFIATMVLLAIVMVTTSVAARTLGFSRADEITIVFCGSQKSLASGIPMATVLLPEATVGLTVLPLMLFHQIQLIVGALLARRYLTRQAASEPAALSHGGTQPR